VRHIYLMHYHHYRISNTHHFCWPLSSRQRCSLQKRAKTRNALPARRAFRRWRRNGLVAGWRGNLRSLHGVSRWTQADAYEGLGGGFVSGCVSRDMTPWRACAHPYC